MEKQENKELNLDYKNENENNSNILQSKIVYQIGDNNYNLQMFVLQELNKLKIYLEVTDKNKTKSLYLNTFTLNDLISQNNFFSGFKDYSQAFKYLLNNYTKINKIEYLPNKNAIKIFLAYSVGDNIGKKNNKQDNIEFVLYYKNMSLNKS